MMTKLFCQLERARWTLLAFYGPAAAVLVAIAIASVASGAPVASFTRDPAAVTGSSPAIGVLSNLGVVIWAATAAIALLAASVLRLAGRETRPGARFFGAAASLTALLLADDLFMLHEQLAAHGLVRERYTLAAYLALTATFLIRQRPAIVRTDFALLALSLAFFAASLGVDAMPETLLPWHHLVEDGAKFLGIVGWCAYFCRAARAALCQNVLPAAARHDAAGDRWA